MVARRQIDLQTVEAAGKLIEPGFLTDHGDFFFLDAKHLMVQLDTVCCVTTLIAHAEKPLLSSLLYYALFSRLATPSHAASDSLRLLPLSLL